MQIFDPILVGHPTQHCHFLRQFLLRALRQCLVAAGAPVDLVQLAPGYADAGKALVEHSDKAFGEEREVSGKTFVFWIS